jgi:PEP-CTERM motif
MMRPKISMYLPHTLLLAGSAACLAFALGSPQDGNIPNNFKPHQEQAEQITQDLRHRSYMDAQGNTRSLAEVLQQARARLDRIQQNQSKTKDDAHPAQKPLAMIDSDTTHNRMAKNKDAASLPQKTDPHSAPTVEYVGTQDPLAWRRPDALEAREYTVLEFGEIGTDQAQESTPDNNTPVQTTQTTASADIFTKTIETNNDSDSPASVTTTPQANTAVKPLSVSLDTPTAPLAVMQSASRAAPTPVSSHTAATTDRTEPDRDIAPRQADQPTITDARPVLADAPVLVSLPPTETKPAPRDRPVAETRNPGTGTDEPRVKPALAKAPVLKDIQPKTQPVAQDKPRTTPRFTDNTPAITTVKHEETKPDITAIIPPAPKDVLSAKPINKNRDDKTPSSPTKSISKTTNPLVVLIDDYDKVGSDRINAIDKALANINRAVKQADIDIELKITADKKSNYSILFNEDDGKDMGNTLGLTELAVNEDNYGNESFLGEADNARGGKAQVRINNSFNWFAGEDQNKIGKNQYDYQTAVEHEFLHILGLDDDYDNNQAVSNALLSPGEIRREIDKQELEDLSDFYADANPWKSLDNNENRFGKSRREGKTRYKSRALTAAVPEPASLALIGMGLLIGVAGRRR